MEEGRKKVGRYHLPLSFFLIGFLIFIFVFRLILFFVSSFVVCFSPVHSFLPCILWLCLYHLLAFSLSPLPVSFIHLHTHTHTYTYTYTYTHAHTHTHTHTHTAITQHCPLTNTISHKESPSPYALPSF